MILDKNNKNNVLKIRHFLIFLSSVSETISCIFLQKSSFYSRLLSCVVVGTVNILYHFNLRQQDLQEIESESPTEDVKLSDDELANKMETGEDFVDPKAGQMSLFVFIATLMFIFIAEEFVIDSIFYLKILLPVAGIHVFLPEERRKGMQISLFSTVAVVLTVLNLANLQYQLLETESSIHLIVLEMCFHTVFMIHVWGRIRVSIGLGGHQISSINQQKLDIEEETLHKQQKNSQKREGLQNCAFLSNCEFFKSFEEILVLISCEENRIICANDAFLKNFGFLTNKEIENDRFDAIVHASNSDFLSERNDGSIDNQWHELELCSKKSKGFEALLRVLDWPPLSNQNSPSTPTSQKPMTPPNPNVCDSPSNYIFNNYSLKDTLKFEDKPQFSTKQHPNRSKHSRRRIIHIRRKQNHQNQIVTMMEQKFLEIQELKQAIDEPFNNIFHNLQLLKAVIPNHEQISSILGNMSADCRVCHSKIDKYFDKVTLQTGNFSDSRFDMMSIADHVYQSQNRQQCIDLIEIIEKSIDSCYALAEINGIELLGFIPREISETAHTSFSETTQNQFSRIQQVLIFLMKNAISNCEAATNGAGSSHSSFRSLNLSNVEIENEKVVTVRVYVEKDELSSVTILFTVVDNGRGLDFNHQKNLKTLLSASHGNNKFLASRQNSTSFGEDNLDNEKFKMIDVIDRLLICRNILSLVDGGELGYGALEKGSNFWFRVRLMKETHNIEKIAPTLEESPPEPDRDVQAFSYLNSKNELNLRKSSSLSTILTPTTPATPITPITPKGKLKSNSGVSHQISIDLTAPSPANRRTSIVPSFSSENREKSTKSSQFFSRSLRMEKRKNSNGNAIFSNLNRRILTKTMSASAINTMKQQSADKIALNVDEKFNSNSPKTIISVFGNKNVNSIVCKYVKSFTNSSSDSDKNSIDVVNSISNLKQLIEKIDEEIAKIAKGDHKLQRKHTHNKKVSKNIEKEDEYSTETDTFSEIDMIIVEDICLPANLEICQSDLKEILEKSIQFNKMMSKSHLLMTVDSNFLSNEKLCDYRPMFVLVSSPSKNQFCSNRRINEKIISMNIFDSFLEKPIYLSTFEKLFLNDFVIFEKFAKLTDYEERRSKTSQSDSTTENENTSLSKSRNYDLLTIQPSIC